MTVATARDDFMRAINDIRAYTNNPKILDATYELEVLSAAFWPTNINDHAARADRWAEYNLAPFEARMMDALAAKMGKTVSHESLMGYMYFQRKEDWPDQNTLKVRVCHIRRKIKNSPYRVEVVWGVGYRLVLRVPGEDEKAKSKASLRDRTAWYCPSDAHVGARLSMSPRRTHSDDH